MLHSHPHHKTTKNRNDTVRVLHPEPHAQWPAGAPKQQKGVQLMYIIHALCQNSSSAAGRHPASVCTYGNTDSTDRNTTTASLSAELFYRSTPATRLQQHGLPLVDNTAAAERTGTGLDRYREYTSAHQSNSNSVHMHHPRNTIINLIKPPILPILMLHSPPVWTLLASLMLPGHFGICSSRSLYALPKISTGKLLLRSAHYITVHQYGCCLPAGFSAG